MRLYDVTVPLSPVVEPWPGDTPTRLERTARLEAGDSVNVTTLTASVHNGTHVDAPLHVASGGTPVSALPLEPFAGPAVLLDAPEAFELDGKALEAAVPRGSRVLIRTGREDFHSFPERLVPLPPDWIQELGKQAVPLVGTDQPSVDPVESVELPAHHACVARGIQILENLALDGVPSGRCELTAYPLRLEGADAAPVRAVLAFPHRADEGPGSAGDPRARQPAG